MLVVGYEIDFLPVGDGSKGGDAIALRYGNLYGPRDQQTVVVIDGGYLDDGEAIVDVVRTHYNTDRVDVVVSTHPDRDHIKGLEVVLRKLSVGQLWMHIPENHDPVVAAASHSFNKEAMVGERLAKSLTDSDSLLALATELHIPIVEPFSGLQTAGGFLTVVGPDEGYYEEKLAAMRGVTAAASLPEAIAKALRSAKEFIFDMVSEDTWLETLSETSEVSASNNSSVVLLLRIDGKSVLLTGDAGAEALHRVADRLEAVGIRPTDLAMVQIPHHGSRHNVTPSLLNRLLGSKGQSGVGAAYASTPKENPARKHPAKKTLNAFTRRGYRTFDTAGRHVTHRHQAPDRAGWTSLAEHPLYQSVESHDD